MSRDYYTAEDMQERQVSALERMAEAVEKLVERGEQYAVTKTPPGRSIVEIVRDLIDPDGCDFDHHGGCQAHGYLSLEPGEVCPQEEAKRWLAAQDAGEDQHDGE